MRWELSPLAVCACLAMLLVGAITHSAPATRPVTQEAAYQVRMGMSVEEVETIMGRPGEPCDAHDDRIALRWRGDDFTLRVFFRKEDRRACFGSLTVRRGNA